MSPHPAGVFMSMRYTMIRGACFMTLMVMLALVTLA